MSCEVEKFCVNYDGKCWTCRAENPTFDDLHYRSNGDPKAPKVHPIRQAEKDQRKQEQKNQKKQEALEKRDKKGKNVMAALMEKKANNMANKAIERRNKKSFMSPTANSGRTHRDVDHIMHAGQIRLDSKHQSKRLHPQINLNELDQAIIKSQKFKSDLGGLIIWNQNERPVVVFAYEDWLKWEASKGTIIKENSKE